MNTFDARPHRNAALTRTVAVTTMTGLTYTLQHWSADLRSRTGSRTERFEWVTIYSTSGNVHFDAHVTAFTSAELDLCREQWAQTMAEIQGQWRLGEVRVRGDLSMLPPAPYSVAYDGAQIPERVGGERQVRPFAPGPMSLTDVELIAF